VITSDTSFWPCQQHLALSTGFLPGGATWLLICATDCCVAAACVSRQLGMQELGFRLRRLRLLYPDYITE
jgi:hypothetical protein